MPQAQKDHLSALGRKRAKEQRERGLATIACNRSEQKEMTKGKTQQVLEHLRKAAQLLAELEENVPAKHFSNAIESLVEVGQYGPQADMVCSMLYAVRESVEMRPALKRHTRDEVLEAARDITGKDLRDLDHGSYEVSDPTPNRCEPSCWMGCPHGVTSIRDEPALHHTPRKRFGPEGEDT